VRKDEAVKLVKQTFAQEYDESRFRYFVRNLFPQVEERDEPAYSGNLIWESFRDDIASYKRIAKFTDNSGEILDVLAIKLKRVSQLENARTMQRNFVARYLNGSRGGELRDAALVAFYAEDAKDWRFSLIKMDYLLDPENNKVKKELTPARRFSFLVGPNERIHTASERLAPLFEEHSRISIAALEEAFNIEVVTKEFFEKYRDLYQKVKGELEYLLGESKSLKSEFEKKNIDADNFSKRLLGQIVFLYFLQKKGWLGVEKGEGWGSGPKNFLDKLFNKELVDYNNFFNDVLEPLFYEALATERPDHLYPPFGCRIPFLNGGLFEPIGHYDWKNIDIPLSDERFKDIFETFNLYNFTVREDEPLETEVAVDPEMLGNVFEKLMSEEERGKSGAFYTPKSVVHYMSQQSLINYLDTELNTVKKPITQTGPEQKQLFSTTGPKQEELYEEVYEEQIPRSDIEEYIHLGDLSIETERNIAQKGTETKTYKHQIPESIRSNAQTIDELLAKIRILDPAIGSGAFPVGMMNEVVRARLALNALVGKPDRTPFEVKWHCIQESLYGTDINLSAVDIAKLRLWLSLVVEEENFKDIKPLPNLDYKIRTGDSLIGFTVDTSKNYQDLLAKLPPLKKAFFSETDSTKKTKLREEIETLLQSRYSKSKASEGIEINFEPRLEFLEVFEEKGGFDVVIANPPYVRQEKIKHFKPHLEKRFKHVYTGTADYLVYFYEMGWKLLKPNGCLTFISSNKYMRTAYGKKLRGFLKDNTFIHKIIDFGDLPVFQGVIAYPSIIICHKAQLPNPQIKVLATRDINCLNNLDRFFADNQQIVIQEELTSEIWQLNPYPELTAKINNISTTLDEFVEGKFFRGIVTGCNKAFIIDRKTREDLISAHSSSEDVIKPFIEGEDIGRYKISFSEKYLIYIPWHFPLHEKNIQGASEEAERAFKKSYPAIYEHLFNFKKELSDRNKTETGIRYEWYALQRFGSKYWKEFDKPKITWGNLATQASFSFDEYGYYINAPACFLPIDQKWLLGVLNSKMSTFYLKHNAIERQNGFFEQKPMYMDRLPIPNLSESEKRNIEEFTSKLIKLYSSGSKSKQEMSSYENEIDKILYSYYQLSPDEIAIIENQAESSEVMEPVPA
jgi:hypothetical protein